MLCSPLGSAISGFLVSKIKLPPIYIFLVAAILQTVGLALMGTLPVTKPGVSSAQYGYQVILGLGIGLTLSSLIVAAPTVIDDKDTGTSLHHDSRHDRFLTSSSCLYWRIDAIPDPRREHWPRDLH